MLHTGINLSVFQFLYLQYYPLQLYVRCVRIKFM